MIAGAFLLPQMNAYAYSTSDAELEPYRDNSVINDLGFDLPTFKYKVLYRNNTYVLDTDVTYSLIMKTCSIVMSDLIALL